MQARPSCWILDLRPVTLPSTAPQYYTVTRDGLQARCAMCFQDSNGSLGQLLYIAFYLEFITLTSDATVAIVMYQGGKTACCLSLHIRLVDIHLRIDCC